MLFYILHYSISSNKYSYTYPSYLQFFETIFNTTLISHYQNCLYLAKLYYSFANMSYCYWLFENCLYINFFVLPCSDLLFIYLFSFFICELGWDWAWLFCDDCWDVFDWLLAKRFLVGVWLLLLVNKFILYFIIL